MAEIAKTAGMSPGHIYNLFENKDDIIAAIVERDCTEIVQRINDLQQERDILKEMLGETAKAIDEHTHVADAALQLEVLAEASRNPKLAAVVHAGEAQVHAKALELIRQTLGPAAADLPPEDIQGRALLLAAIFSGLTALSVRQPGLHLRIDAMAPVMQRVLRVLLAP
jgi:TetR/AcrR family transcriptional regulator, repressor for uid operon